MRIVSARLNVVDLPLRVPFRTALRSTQQVTDIRVALETDDGRIGWGSASPTPAITGETTESIISALENFIFPKLQGIELLHQESAHAALRSAIVHNRSAKAAVDIALYDIYAQQSGVSLSTYLRGMDLNDTSAFGGKDQGIPVEPITLPAPTVPSNMSTISTDSTVSLAAPDVMEKQARELVNEGFSVLKVKLGGRDGLDVERVRRVRESVGEHVIIRVDANQAWEIREGIQYAKELASLHVELIEQPVPSYDVEGLAQITQNSEIPIAADESVYDRYDLLHVIDKGAAHIVNIKLMKSGGIHEAREMIRLARSAGLEFMIGSMMEGPASVTAAAHLANAYDCRYIDLDAAYFLSDMRAEGGITYDASTITLPSSPGLGVSLEKMSVR